MGVSEKPKYDFQGIKRIEIPKIDADFMPDNNYGIDVIKNTYHKYLSHIKEMLKKKNNSTNFI